MISSSRSLARLAALALASPALFVPASRAYVFGDPVTLAEGRVALDFNFRARLEARENTFDFNSATETVNDDTFLLTRARAGAKVTFSPRAVFYAQLQDAREYDSKRVNVPYTNAAEGNGPLDLRQLYLDLGDARDDTVYARVGRQMLAYGDERLIGGFEWNNLARTFDAVKVVWQAPSVKTTVDAFAAQVVTMGGRRLGEENDLELDRSSSHDVFAGLYAQNSGFVPNQRTDVYLLYRDKDRNAPIYRPNPLTGGPTGVAPYDVPQRIWTFGVRAQSVSSARLRGFDYLAEAALQWGEARPGLTPAQTAVPGWFDHDAWALHLEAGYTVERSTFLPRFALEYNLASGDRSSADQKNEGFLNLFHTNHKFYGYMDVASWKNLENVAVTARFKPLARVDSSLKKSVLRLDYHWLWLERTTDFWYRANAITTVRPAASRAGTLPREAGQEFDATWMWSPSPPYDVLLGYSYFWSGAYLAATGAADDATFGYAQLVVKF